MKFRSGDKLRFTEKWKSEALAEGYSQESVDRIFEFVRCDKAMIGNYPVIRAKCDNILHELIIDSVELAI